MSSFIRSVRRGDLEVSDPARHCYWCGRGFTRKRTGTVDHVIPRSKGGGNDSTNLVLACNRCNNSKADYSPSEWAVLLIRQLQACFETIGERSPALLND